MAEEGLNLSEIMKKAASMVGDSAEATTWRPAPPSGDKKEEFLEIVEDLVSPGHLRSVYSTAF